MNAPLRRVAIAVLVLFGALIVNSNWVQVVHADKLRSDSQNHRILFSEYEHERGQIIVDGKAIASSVATDDRLKYLRTYADGPLYAPVTGYYSFIYDAGGMERAERDILSGNDDRLFVSNLADLFTGRDPKGGNVVLTINSQAQRAAYEGLTNQVGAVVALDPRDGAILALASSPSYDPNPIASHDGDTVRDAWESYGDAKPDPMLDRAIQARYPPGSVFKTIISAAALKDGLEPDDRIPAPTDYTLPGTNTPLHNFENETCGDGQTDTFRHALQISCNTAFAQLGIDLGEDKVREQAEAFGVNDEAFGMPLKVEPSTLGDIPDDAALGQSSIGQRDVAITPMEGAMIAATVANGGELFEPHLVRELQSPDLKTIETTEPTSRGRAMSSGDAATLRDMMVNVVENGTGQSAQIDGVSVGGKTGTAENQEGAQPHAWFIGFAPADHPTVAVAVLLEHAGNAGNEVTGGEAAAPIARDVMSAVLESQKGD